MSVRINAVALGVADITRSAAFYEQLGWRRSTISTSTMAVFTAKASAGLILHKLQDLLASAGIQEQASGSDGVTGLGGTTLVMVVDSPEGVHGMLATAVEAGAEVLRLVTQLGYGSHAYFADPDGHVWEVIEAPGFERDAAGSLVNP